MPPLLTAESSRGPAEWLGGYHRWAGEAQSRSEQREACRTPASVGGKVADKLQSVVCLMEVSQLSLLLLRRVSNW